MALGFSMVLGVTRAFNLAHGELVVLGGYVGYWLWAGSGLPPLLLLPAAAAAILPLGLLWQWLLERVPEPRELNSLAVTFGLSLLLQTLMRALWQGDYRLIADPVLTASLRLGPVSLNLGRVLVAAAALLVVGLLWLGLTRTRWGRAVRATSIDAQAAALLGIDIHPAAGVELTLMAIVLTIWAGVGRLRSILVAGILLGIIEAVSAAWAGPRWRETAVALLLLGSLLARSGGLAPGMSGAGHGR